MKTELQNFLATSIQSQNIESMQAVSGGCINQCYRITLDATRYFLKCNTASINKLFACEAHGLQELADVAVLRVPKVLAHGESGKYQFLLCEYIEEGSRGGDFFRRFGRALARFHKQGKRSSCGFSEDNYLGSAVQKNTPKENFTQFFAECRLGYQYQWARKQGLLDKSSDVYFNKVVSKLDSMLTDETPVVLHGDLWGGNFMADAAGNAVLIDPAVYYGNRETDLAMTELFSGFSSDFYRGYAEEYPLQPGYDERRDMYNLYHLMNHLNLFGRQYYVSVVNILRRYGN